MAELYQDLSLPLNIFIRCIVHSDLSGLVLKGKPSPEDTAIAWANIYSQYIDLNAENESIYIVKLQAEIVLLSAHINQVETCLYFLAETYHVGLLGLLLLNGYEPPDNFNDKEKYYTRLKTIQNKLARKKIDLISKTKEYEDYIQAHSKDEITEKYFIITLLRLAKYQGVAIIRSKDISVGEFVMLLQDYLSQNKQADGEEGN